MGTCPFQQHRVIVATCCTDLELLSLEWWLSQSHTAFKDCADLLREGEIFESREPFRCSPPTPLPAEGARDMQWILFLFISLARCISCQMPALCRDYRAFYAGTLISCFYCRHARLGFQWFAVR